MCVCVSRVTSRFSIIAMDTLALISSRVSFFSEKISLGPVYVIEDITANLCGLD